LRNSQGVLAASGWRADGSGLESTFLPNQSNKKLNRQAVSMSRRLKKEANRLLYFSIASIRY
jgi:hypothetical protein